MRRETVTIPGSEGVDWKGIGYLFSVASALLLGAIAWPKPSDPEWHAIALIAGIVTSIVGFGLRYFAHLRQRAELQRTKREAERR